MARRQQSASMQSMTSSHTPFPAGQPAGPSGLPWSLLRELQLSSHRVPGTLLTAHDGTSCIGSCQDSAGNGHHQSLFLAAFWVLATGSPKEKMVKVGCSAPAEWLPHTLPRTIVHSLGSHVVPDLPKSGAGSFRPLEGPGNPISWPPATSPPTPCSSVAPGCPGRGEGRTGTVLSHIS